MREDSSRLSILPLGQRRLCSCVCQGPVRGLECCIPPCPRLSRERRPRAWCPRGLPSTPGSQVWALTWPAHPPGRPRCLHNSPGSAPHTTPTPSEVCGLLPKPARGALRLTKAFGLRRTGVEMRASQVLVNALDGLGGGGLWLEAHRDGPTGGNHQGPRGRSRTCIPGQWKEDPPNTTDPF